MRKTCWPRLRNWTTAMRMWCNTRTMLAAARPPRQPGPLRSVSASATASPVRARVRPGPAPPPPPPRPRPPGPAYVSATRDSTSASSEDGTPPHPDGLAPCRAFTLPRLLQRIGCGDPLSSVASQPSLPSSCPIATPPIWQSPSQSPEHCRTTFAPHHFSGARAPRPNPAQCRERDRGRSPGALRSLLSFQCRR